MCSNRLAECSDRGRIQDHLSQLSSQGTAADEGIRLYAEIKKVAVIARITATRVRQLRLSRVGGQGFIIGRGSTLWPVTTHRPARPHSRSRMTQQPIRLL